MWNTPTKLAKAWWKSMSDWSREKGKIPRQTQKIIFTTVYQQSTAWTNTQQFSKNLTYLLVFTWHERSAEGINFPFSIQSEIDGPKRQLLERFEGLKMTDHQPGAQGAKRVAT